MPYSERFPIKFPQGLHNGPLFGMVSLGLPKYGLTINGQPLNNETFDHFAYNYKSPAIELEVGANSGDPNLDRDVVTIAKHHIQRGRSIWPNAPGEIPADQIPRAAEALRQQEASFSPAAGEVTSRQAMSRPFNEIKEGAVENVSKWTVVALGERQLPGGVGATMPGADDSFNPVVDGPNALGPDFTDNAGNSMEQEHAVETWVNMAIELLNRGEPENAVLAQLAHDGCPDPKGVLTRAMQQGVEQPVTNDAGADPFASTPQSEPLGANDQVAAPPASQQAYASHERIVISKTGQQGTVLETYENMWGQGLMRVALDSGRIVDIEPSMARPLTDIETPDDPIAEIQSWLDAIPEPTHTHASIDSLIANMQKANSMIHQARSSGKLSLSEQIKLDSLSTDVALTLSEARLAKQAGFNGKIDGPSFEIDHWGLGDKPYEPELRAQYAGRVKEAATIWASESHWRRGDDYAAFQDAVFRYANEQAMGAKQTEEFLFAAQAWIEKNRGAHPSYVTASVEESVMNDGPAEALFM